MAVDRAYILCQQVSSVPRLNVIEVYMHIHIRPPNQTYASTFCKCLEMSRRISNTCTAACVCEGMRIKGPGDLQEPVSVVLVFESHEDAQRYGGMLEDQHTSIFSFSFPNIF